MKKWNAAQEISKVAIDSHNRRDRSVCQGALSLSNTVGKIEK
jgi:hypothetical protein